MAEFVFSRAPGGETYLRQQYCVYPFHVCRPHRFAGDPSGMITLYVQSSAGGVFEDDRLLESITLETGTRVHVTTQAASIVHSMTKGDARLEVFVEVNAGSFLELLPDPLILFPKSRLSMQLRIRVNPTATVIVGDSFLLHDPAGRGGLFDSLCNELSVETLSGSPIVLDRFAIPGTLMVGGGSGINGAYVGHGSLTVLDRTRPGGELVEVMRGAVRGLPGIYAGASILPGDAGAWLRVLAEDGAALRHCLHAGWQAIRCSLTGSTAPARRK